MDYICKKIIGKYQLVFWYSPAYLYSSDSSYHLHDYIQAHQINLC
jgi:hypothetical protein